MCSPNPRPKRRSSSSSIEQSASESPTTSATQQPRSSPTRKNRRSSGPKSSACSKASIRARPTNASLSLAVLQHFNAYFSVAFAVVITRGLIDRMMKRSITNELHRSVIFPCFILWWIVEAVRLHVGQTGNVNERVPSLAAFVLLSIIPQVPIIIYIGYFVESVSITDTVLASLMLAMLVPEIIIGYRTLQAMIKAQTEAFYKSYELDKEQQRIEREQKEADILFWSKELNCLNNSKDNSGIIGKK